MQVLLIYPLNVHNQVFLMCVFWLWRLTVHLCMCVYVCMLQRYRGYFGVNRVGSSFKEGFEMGLDLPEGDPDIQSGFPLRKQLMAATR